MIVKSILSLRLVDSPVFMIFRISTQSESPAAAAENSESGSTIKDKKKGGMGAAFKKGLQKLTKSKSIEESTTAGMVAAAGMQVTNTYKFINMDMYTPTLVHITTFSLKTYAMDVSGKTNNRKIIKD